MLLPNESQSICLSFRKHSLSSKTLRTLAALDVLIRKASAITIGSAYFAHPHIGYIGRYGNPAASVHRDCCPFHIPATLILPNDLLSLSPSIVRSLSNFSTVICLLGTVCNAQLSVRECPTASLETVRQSCDAWR